MNCKTVQIGTLVAFLAGLLSLSAMATEASQFGKRFRGHDDRVMLDTLAPPYAAIGRLNLNAGRQFCSGTLIAPDKVITAAHCLLDRRTGRPFRPHQVHFVAGLRRDTYVDHSRARCLRPIKRNAAAGTATIDKYVDDVAVVVLDRPLKVEPVSLAAAYIADPGPLSHPAYSKSRPFLLSVHDGCRLLHKSRGMWLTDCDTAYGSSGGPLLSEIDADPKLIAIMSGTRRVRGELFSIAVPITIWGELARTARCVAE